MMRASATADRELTVTRVFDAPRRLVFKVWTSPEHAARWWGPQGHESITCTMDVRPGGAWERRMRTPDGARYRKYGVYREVAAPERLVFTYQTEDSSGQVDHETLVTVTFAEAGGKTRLTLHQAIFETAELCAAHHGGWTSCFERFATYIAEHAK
jgi:uncharacterized protein YndB with AHSA1/START domain